MEVLIVFDTRYENTHRLAEAVAEGAREIRDTEADLKRARITEPEAIINQHEDWRKGHERFKAVPPVTIDDLVQADAIVFGSPARFGTMMAPVKKLFDGTGRIWAEGKLFGNVGAASAGTSTPHGENETTLITMFLPMYHHRMIVVTPGYGDPAVFGAGSPHGATPVGEQGADNPPTDSDLRVARSLGRGVAQVVEALPSARALLEAGSKATAKLPAWRSVRPAGIEHFRKGVDLDEKNDRSKPQHCLLQ